MIFPSPWLILAGVLVVGAAGGSGYISGRKAGGDAVQVRWDRAEAQRTATALENQRMVQRSNDKLQDAQNLERKQSARIIEILNGNVAALTRSLSSRPARPAVGPSVMPPAASAGTDLRCTGAGLYRDDAELLVGRSAAAQRIRIQRDNCYAAYERAAGENEALNASGSSR